jgi:hypothetical protein
MSEVSINPGQEAEVLSAEDQVRAELFANIDKVITESLSDSTSDTTDYKDVEGAVEYLKAGFGQWFEMVEVTPVSTEEGEEPEAKEQFAQRILDALDNPPQVYAQIEEQVMFGTETIKNSTARSDDFGNWALDVRMDAVAIQNAIDFDQELELFQKNAEQSVPAAE